MTSSDNVGPPRVRFVGRAALAGRTAGPHTGCMESGYATVEQALSKPPPSRSPFWSFAAPRLTIAAILFWSFPLTFWVFVPFSFDATQQDQDAPFHLLSFLATFASVPAFLSAKDPRVPDRAGGDVVGAMLISFAATLLLAMGIALVASWIPSFGATGALSLLAVLSSAAAFITMRGVYARTDRIAAQPRAYLVAVPGDAAAEMAGWTDQQIIERLRSAPAVGIDTSWEAVFPLIGSVAGTGNMLADHPQPIGGDLGCGSALFIDAESVAVIAGRLAGADDETVEAHWGGLDSPFIDGAVYHLDEGSRAYAMWGYQMAAGVLRSAAAASNGVLVAII